MDLRHSIGFLCIISNPTEVLFQRVGFSLPDWSNRRFFGRLVEPSVPRLVPRCIVAALPGASMLLEDLQMGLGQDLGGFAIGVAHLGGLLAQRRQNVSRTGPR